MHIVDKLQQVRMVPNSDGTEGEKKGTNVFVIEDNGRKHVEKQWVFGDWVFTADYEYHIEKCIYTRANAIGLPVPKLLDSNDSDRVLRLEFIQGPRIETPCVDTSLMMPVLQFHDQFKNIILPDDAPPHKMDHDCVHKYRLDQLKWHYPNDRTWKYLDRLYESFLKDIPYYTLPFDSILRNSLQCKAGLVFVDFEWTIAGPYEFTLARIAAEFRCYDAIEIISRADNLEFYQLFLLRFYMWGRDPELLHRYLLQNIRNKKLREIFDLVNVEKYGNER